MRILYTLTVFLSSALLFLIQPMVGKIILPAFGGSAAVWTATMVFFQAALLGGYAYAHFSTAKLGAKRQAMIHVPLMVLALLTLPFATHIAGGATTGQTSLVGVLAALAVMVGAVFFIVSAGAPLLQRWFASTDDKDGKDPYFLYSASNLGSMLALIAYPLIVEPRFKLSEQTRLWMFGFIALAGLMALCAGCMFFRGRPAETPAEVSSEGEPPKPLQRAMWVLLGAVPTSLLLGVTAYLSSNVAPIPLLWVIPLALYLLTFTQAFARRTYLTSANLARYLPLVVTPLALCMILESSDPLVPLAVIHLLGFFMAALMCHARLSESRPDPKHLTEFYLWISVGGVLGGLFNAALAPYIFTTLLEYPLAIVVVCFLRPPRAPQDATFGRWDALYPTLLGFLTLGIAITVQLMKIPASHNRTLIAVGLPAILCFMAVDRPKRYALSLAAVFMAAFAMHISANGNVVYTGRSFFGVHRIVTFDHGNMYQLIHGTTTHGQQDRRHPLEPLTYYTKQGPIGHVFAEFHGPTAKKHVALVGLGAGTMAAYGEPGQTMTYFEIDPVVEAIATNTRYFTYLHDSKAAVNIVMGDARLTLATEPDSRFGLIILDAFSSDAIPIHLLTEEAFQLYLSKLEPHGVIAVHISNRFLDLDPVIDDMARDLHLVARIDRDYFEDDIQSVKGRQKSTWVILARDVSDFGKLAKSPDWGPMAPAFPTPAWTDDFSNVLSVLRPPE